jgi:cobalt-zinc-cadmium efflux system membrane fusion protein
MNTNMQNQSLRGGSPLLHTGLKMILSLMMPMLIAALTLLSLPPGTAHAAPGAHGPNGEHLGAPPTAASTAQRPRVTAQSDVFELVAELHEGELSIMIDRFDTNEPLLGAKVEVESAGIKAKATFHDDLGDYALDDEKLLALLKKPGEHALVFTIVASDTSDLLDGVLVNAADSAAHGHDHDHAHTREIVLIALAILLGVVSAFLLWRRVSRRGQLGSLGRANSVIMFAVMPVSFLGVIALLSWHSTALAAPGAHGPNGEHLDAPAGLPSGSALARLADGSVNVPKIAQRRMAIRTVLAPESEAALTIELPGRVIMDPNAGGRVQAVHGGKLEAGPKGLPLAGQRVSKGEVLAYVRHHAEPFAVGSQQAQLADLQAQRKLAEQRVSRLDSLEGTVPRKDIEAAREEAASLREREARIAQSLSAREALSSPVDGVVARVDAVLGQVLEARDIVFEVVDPYRVLVEATTADATLAGQVATAKLQGMEGVQLSLIGAARVLRDGVLPLTFAAKPESRPQALPLAIGQPVMVLAQTHQRIKGIVLPAQAVVRNPSNEPIVWIKSGPERFIPQPVQYRFLDARTVVVTQGLSADNRVVVQAAPLIAQIR